MVLGVAINSTRPSLSTSMSVVESEVLMMIDELEGNGSQCSLKHVLGGGSGMQVVKTSVQIAVAGSVIRSSNTIVDQADKTSLCCEDSVSKDLETDGWERTHHIALLLGLLASCSSLSSASCGREQNLLMTEDQLLMIRQQLSMIEGQWLRIEAGVVVLLLLSDMVL
jgi:hypothetical protein